METNDELTGLDGFDGASDFLDDATVLVSHRRWLLNWIDAAVWPQVRPAHTCCGSPNSGIRRLDDCWELALLKSHVTRTVQNSSSHDLSPFSFSLVMFPGDGPMFIWSRRLDDQMPVSGELINAGKVLADEEVARD
jgi:hypothetical protein